MADTISLLSFLDNIIGSSHAPTQRNEHQWHCPFCSHHKQKLAINVSTGQWHCWVCNTAGRTLFSLLKRLGGSRDQMAALARLLGERVLFTQTEEESESILILPQQFQPLWESSRDPEYKIAMAYLKGRGVSISDVMKHQMGYCTSGHYANRIIIPSYGNDGRLNFFTGRTYYKDDNYRPYLNPTASKNIVGFESLISWDFPIVICEGPMDALAIRRNAIPIFGKTLPKRLWEEIVSNDVRDIYLALDRDALREASDMAEYLRREDRNVFVVEMDGKDPSKIGFAGMMEKIRNTTEPFTFKNVITAKLASLRTHGTNKSY